MGIPWASRDLIALGLGRHDYFLYLPLLPEVRLRLGDVDTVDLGARRISYADPEGGRPHLGYDRLGLAVGSVNKLLLIPRVATQGPLLTRDLAAGRRRPRPSPGPTTWPPCPATGSAPQWTGCSMPFSRANECSWAWCKRQPSRWTPADRYSVAEGAAPDGGWSIWGGVCTGMRLRTLGATFGSRNRRTPCSRSAVQDSLLTSPGSVSR